jgi:hypothetical protein
MNDFESSFPAIDTQNEVSTHFTPSPHKVKSVAILSTPTPACYWTTDLKLCLFL